jgi:hypothetical protein
MARRPLTHPAAHSPFLEHALVLGWRPGHILAILWAYLEETGPAGDLDGIVVGIGGLRTTCAAWSGFNGKWQEVLDSEGVDVLHMKHVYSGQHAPYRSWSDDKKTKFLLRLVDVIGPLGPPLGAMKSLPVHPRKRDHVGQAYRRACHECMRSALSCVPPDSKVHFVFARRLEISPPLLDQYHGWVIDAYTRVRDDGRVGQLVLGDPGDLPPLQAADLIASELARHVRQPEAIHPSIERLREMGRVSREYARDVWRGARVEE